MSRNVFAVWVGLSLSIVPFAEAESVKLIQELPRLETQLSMVVVNGLLLSTNSRMNEYSGPRCLDSSAPVVS
jgi:hypothetical protein